MGGSLALRVGARKQQPGERETGGPHAIAAAELMGRLESLCISELNAGDLPSESSGAWYMLPW